MRNEYYTPRFRVRENMNVCYLIVVADRGGVFVTGYIKKLLNTTTRALLPRV